MHAYMYEGLTSIGWVTRVSSEEPAESQFVKNIVKMRVTPIDEIPTLPAADLDILNQTINMLTSLVNSYVENRDNSADQNIESKQAAFKEKREYAMVWRNDALETAAKIAEQYGADPQAVRDIRALVHTELPPIKKE